MNIPVNMENLCSEKKQCIVSIVVMTGHTMSTCFKIHGYPEWYKELKQNRNSAKARANMVIDELNSPFESEDIYTTS